MKDVTPSRRDAAHAEPAPGAQGRPRERSLRARLIWLGKAVLFVLSLGMLFPHVFWEDDA